MEEDVEEKRGNNNELKKKLKEVQPQRELEEKVEEDVEEKRGNNNELKKKLKEVQPQFLT